VNGWDVDGRFVVTGTMAVYAGYLALAGVAAYMMTPAGQQQTQELGDALYEGAANIY